VRKLAFDLGEIRVGVAISDPTATLARPFGVLPRKALDGSAERVSDMIREQGVDEVVVGLPRTMRGEEGHMAVAARVIAEHLHEVLHIPVSVFDERLTSVAARRAMAGCGRVRHGDGGGVDQVAAAIILQNFLDRRHQYGAGRSRGPIEPPKRRGPSEHRRGER